MHYGINESDLSLNLQKIELTRYARRLQDQTNTSSPIEWLSLTQKYYLCLYRIHRFYKLPATLYVCVVDNWTVEPARLKEPNRVPPTVRRTGIQLRLRRIMPIRDTPASNIPVPGSGTETVPNKKPLPD